MEKRMRKIEKFLTDYAARFNDILVGGEPDVEGTINCFTEYFVEANPKGVIGVQNDERFAQRIQKSLEFYKEIGTTSMTIEAYDTSFLDDGHALVKVHWLAQYLKDNEKVEITFDVHYLLQEREDGYRIFAYITGDEEKALKEKGLLTDRLQEVYK